VKKLNLFVILFSSNLLVLLLYGICIESYRIEIKYQHAEQYFQGLFIFCQDIVAKQKNIYYI